MSYILEALKKSERERESSNLESAIPVIESTPNAGVESAPIRRYWWVIGFIVCSVCIVFISSKFSMMGAGEEGQAQLVDVKKKAVANSIIENAIFESVLIQEKQSVKPLEKGIGAADIAEEIIVKGIEKEQMAETRGATIIQPQIIRSAIAAEQAPENIQSLLPVIEVSSHIYSSLAERRSIVINGERLVEADFITPQVQIKEITNQGMIVKIEGWSLVVSRSRGWSR
jgi:general secretion pathway protein B